MRAMVCGGAGYIGSHMVRALDRAGHDVLVFDDLSTGHRPAIAGIPLYEGNILDAEALDAAMGGFRPDVVFHFAALSIVADSVREPLRYYRNNVNGSAELIEAMVRHGVRRIVFSSTAAVYGTPQGREIAESHPLNPINPYGSTKLVVEKMLAEAARAYGIRSVSLRYFNAAGADPMGDIGEAHEPETHLVPNALRAAMGGPPLTVFGTDYGTRDGTCIRDYVHVNDLARAHLLAADYLADHEGAYAFNLGSGRGCTVREIIDAVARVSGHEVAFSLGARREGDPAELVADHSLAARELGWAPTMSDVDSIVETAWRWHSSVARQDMSH